MSQVPPPDAGPSPEAVAADATPAADPTGLDNPTGLADPTGPVEASAPADLTGTATEVAADELAFDVEDLPGGALAALEAVLMVADEPIPAVRLASVLALPTTRVQELLDELAAEYRGDRGGRPRGFELRLAGAGWRIYSASPYADVVGRFVLEGQTARLTQAALETLAVIAYRQPVTRGQVSGVRGVNVDGVVRTLTARGLVAEAGTEPTTGAVLYETTGYFLERMGLASLDELPPLAPYLPDIDTLEGVDRANGEAR
ncbi:SMC-Scp complex subunit ScpB [Cellulomonas cellasea]|uniref:Segregation and condensation protein B n=1 Tax=Cellulomonas cellasea TaxID=43670 RepID=A0A7W4UCG9_9CELL|nr:SMC-Scp complex subunit ScpB [Cellulomonas cellasea]MBB2921661.1 segregation and condensation protein B [Cellulomonas cellasea]